jgi:hypothetical protein
MNAAPVGAFFWDDWIARFVKTSAPAANTFTLDADIALSKDGDVNNNGLIDSGDVVTFVYSLTNTTDKKYAFATLATHINRQQINFIHNIKGAVSLKDDGQTITIPNIKVASHQTTTVSLDARVNYFTNEDPFISTEPELLDMDGAPIARSIKKEVRAKRIRKDVIPTMVKQFIGL